jgi:nucleoside-diphosphate-sugar epimerase
MDSEYAPMKRHAFVTGATGFLGRNLIEELARRGWGTTALCLPTEKTESLMRPDVQIVIGNLTDVASLVAAVPTALDAWSAHDAQQYQDNVVGTGHMLDVALQKGAKRFV